YKIIATNRHRTLPDRTKRAKYFAAGARSDQSLRGFVTSGDGAPQGSLASSISPMPTPIDRPSQVPGMSLFPDQNPHPVMRMDAAGALVYANVAAAPILAAWGIRVGESLPADIAEALRRAAAQQPPGSI